MKTETEVFKLSDRVAVEFTIAADGRIDAVWDPTLPARLTQPEADAYRSARNTMLGRLAQRLGVGFIACVEV